MALLKCTECGANVSEKALVCPKCGCPIEVTIEKTRDDKKDNVRKKIIIGITVLTFVILGIGIYYFKNKPDASGYYKGFRWGMSYEEVVKQLGDITMAKDDNKKTIVTNTEEYEGKDDVVAVTSYDCQGGALSAITIFITIEDNSTYTDKSLRDEYTKQYDKLYGEHESDSVFQVWNTEKSKIQLLIFMEDLVVIKYEDATEIDKK